jgi:hypothetical protein
MASGLQNPRAAEDEMRKRGSICGMKARRLLLLSSPIAHHLDLCVLQPEKRIKKGQAPSEPAQAKQVTFMEQPGDKNSS